MLPLMHQTLRYSSRSLQAITSPALFKSIEEAVTTPHGPLAAADPIAENFASIAERSGYLKEVCGIDFGWGTTSLFQWIVEDLHVYSGLSWSLSFVAVSVVIRLLMFPTAVRAQDMAVRMRELQPVLNPLREEYKVAVANGDKIKIQSLGHQMRAVSRDAGVSVTAAFLPMILQIPLSIAGYRLGHAMGSLPVPALENETFLWFTNLALSDPWILPCFCAALGYLTLRGATSASPQVGTGQTIQKVLLYTIPPTSLLFIHWQPGIVQIFFAVQTAFIAAQSRLFHTPLTRSWLKLPPLPSKPRTTSRPTSPSSASPNQPIQPTQIAGMKLRPSPSSTKSASPSQTPSGPNTVPQQDVSVIDKVVDNFKSKRDSVKDTFGSIRKKHGRESGEGREEREQQKLETYEYKRRQDAEMERNWAESEYSGGEGEGERGEVDEMKMRRIRPCTIKDY